MPRYLPVQIDSANDTVKPVYAEVHRRFGLVPNFIKTLAHSDRILKPVADAYLSLTGETGLSEKLTQLIILKVGRLDKCQYVIDRHTPLASGAGLNDEQLQAIDDYGETDAFSFYEKEALRLVELIRSTPDEITPEFWTQLDNHYTSDQVVEMIALIGFQGMLNRLILSLQIEPDKP
jgi:AhpD family alkylhydroperoxidase